MDLKSRYKKKRQPILLQLRWYGSFGALLIIGIWAFFWMPILRVAHITTNDSSLSQETIRNALANILASKNELFLPRSNIFLFSSNKAEQVLREAGIGIARVQKRYPNTILVEFENFEPKFIFCPDIFCYYINQSGMMSEKAPIFSENPLPLLVVAKEKPILGDQIIEKHTASFLAILLSGIEPLNNVAEKIEIQKDDSIHITIQSGSDRVSTWRLLVSSALFPEKLAADLGLLLREKIKDNISKLEYIDMRFPDKAFFKLN